MMHIVDNGVDVQFDDYALPKPDWLRTALFNTLSVGQSVSKAEGDIPSAFVCKSRRDCPEASIGQFVSRQKKMLQ